MQKLSGRPMNGEDLRFSRPAPLVAMAVVVGGILTSLPILLALFQPKRLPTRSMIRRRHVGRSHVWVLHQGFRETEHPIVHSANEAGKLLWRICFCDNSL